MRHIVRAAKGDEEEGNNMASKSSTETQEVKGKQRGWGRLN